MHITDPIADMLTRIRNANNAKHDTVDVPASNMKKAIAQILLEEGYIKNFQLIDDGTQGVIRGECGALRPAHSAGCGGDQDQHRGPVLPEKVPGTAGTEACGPPSPAGGAVPGPL